MSTNLPDVRRIAMGLAAPLLAATIFLSTNAKSSAQSSASSSASTPVTFSHDIAPIVLGSCASCHRPDGSAPFSLLTYPDVKDHAAQIVAAVADRRMPPWKPEPGYGEFIGARRLTDGQVELFQRWLANGAQPGDLTRLLPVPEWKDGWQLGRPDLVVRMAMPYQLRADGPDMLRNFVIPIPLTTRRYVKAWEFRTNNTHVVHHATLSFDPTRASRQLDDQDPQPGYEGLIPLSAQPPDGYFLGWTPGQSPYMAPAQIAWPLDPGTDLVMMMHLRPHGNPQPVEASLGLYFSDVAPSFVPVMIRLNRQDIDIPPGDDHYTITDTYTLPVDVEAYGVQPHAHNLARDVKGFATLPDGTRKWLIYISDWDFHWQDSYRYTTPLPFPAGTKLTMEFTYDNSTANPSNPNKPPRRVIWGQQSTDEMGDLWIQVLPRRPADRALLAANLQARLVVQSIAGYQKMLLADPSSAGLHDDLARLYDAAGQPQEAVREFQESVRLRPQAPATHYNLGTALGGLGRWNEAADRFREAIRLDSTYALAHHGLARVLLSEGRLEEAEAQLRETIRLAPATVDGYYDLGVLRQMQGRLEEALACYADALRIRPDYANAYLAIGLTRITLNQPAAAIAAIRRALEVQPEWPTAQMRLAWILATVADPGMRNADEAVRLAERAIALSPRPDPDALDVLAAASAATGRFDRAIALANQALTLLSVKANEGLETAIRSRLKLYERSQPFVDVR